MIVSVDPGKHVGVASFNNDGSDITRTILDYRDFLSYLKHLVKLVENDQPFKVHLVYEDFALRQDMAIAQTGSDMPAAKAIGALQMAHTMMGDCATIHKADPGNLRGALKWAGFADLANKPRTYHVPDDIAAYAHGVKWLIDQGIRKHPIFD